MTRTSKNQRHFLRGFGFSQALIVVGLWGEVAAADPKSNVEHAPSTSTDTAEQSTERADREVAGSDAKSEKRNTDAFAQRHWHSGMAYLEEGDYAKALEAFTKAYELSARPALLRSIAVAHEKLGDLPHALTAIDLYLQQVPNAPDITEIQNYRAGLQARLDQVLVREKEEKDAAAANKLAPAPSGTSDQASQASENYVFPDSNTTTSPSTEVDSSGTRDVVMWSAIGVGVALGAASVVTGLAAEKEFTRLNRCAPMCTRDDTHEGRTLALTSTVLTGLAIVAGGAAIWAWLSDDDDNTTSFGTHATEFDATYSGDRFMSYAGWRF